MANKSQYRTKQMAEILSYLQSMQGSHVTVHDIHAYFKSKNISVGTTTIYRIVIPPSAFTANAKNAAS